MEATMSAITRRRTLGFALLPGLDMNDWFGLFAAAGVPPPIVARLQAAVVEASRAAAVRERLDPLSGELVASTPEDFARWLAARRNVLQPLIAEAGIKVN